MKPLHLLLLACIVVFSNCGEDDNTNNNNNTNTCSGATMTVNFDGVNHTQTEFNNTLIEAVQGGEGGVRLDLRTNINGGTLVLTVSNWFMHNPPTDGVKEKVYATADIAPSTECSTENGFTYCDGALGTFLTSSSFTYMTFDENHPGFIDIDECNTADKTVSGTFDVLLIGFTQGDTFEVSGSFTNLCYSVLQ